MILGVQSYILRNNIYAVMMKCCSLFEDIPEAIANSVEIAKRCNVTLSFGDNVLPEFPIPESHTPATIYA